MLKFGHKNVLVIDDEVFILEMIRDMLHQLGYQNVQIAQSVDEAMKLIQSKEKRVELVFTDLNMPGVDGIELLRMFDQINYRGDLIIVSGEDEKTLALTETLARARNLSLLGKLAKPVNVERMQRLLCRKGYGGSHRQKPTHKSEVTKDLLLTGLTNSEFEPWFQPKIDVLSQQPVAVEALARWPRELQGLVLPDDFIPVAEQNDMISELTLQIVEKAAGFGKLWRSQGVDLNIAINISMSSLHDPLFADRVYASILAQDKQVKNYSLEVTESRLIENLVTPLESLLRLRMKKLKLSIDDFGTGYSNMNHLKNLPFDELKIDRSYVQQYDDGGRNQCILECSIEVAHRLDMTVVAEGVETLDDWKRLCQLGCDQIQGYFVAKPMPGEMIPEWIKSWPKLSQQLFAAE